jgi:hypothetical protein
LRSSVEEGEIEEEHGPSVTDQQQQETKSQTEVTPALRITRVDASNFFLVVDSATDGGDKAQIDQEFCCLASDPSYLHAPASSEAQSVSEVTSLSGTGARSSASRDDLTIGRSRSNHVVINDLSISKQHAVISYFEDLGLYVRDLGSKHGTYVDGVQITAAEVGRKDEHRLRDGMEIKFGRIVCKVVRKRQAAVLSGR